MSRVTLRKCDQCSELMPEAGMAYGLRAVVLRYVGDKSTEAFVNKEDLCSPACVLKAVQQEAQP